MRRDRPSPELQATPPARWHAAAFACLILSGAAGLIAEVAWIRRASLAFGSTVLALSTVLAVFFFGLALGGLLFGERSRRLERPLRAYALLEIALAVLIALTPWLFDLSESVYGTLYRSAAAPGLALHLARAGLVGLVILAPAILMGGSLPLFCRQFVTTRTTLGSMVALLYGANTLGAAGGALLCGFLLLPALGLRRTLLVAACLDLLAGGVAAAVGWTRAAPILAPAAPSRGRARSTSLSAPWLVGTLFFCAGFVALGNEVLWTRFLGLITPSTVVTYTITLALVLIGIVAGSWLIAVRAADSGARARWFAALQIANGLTGLLVMLLPAALWRSAGGWWAPALLLLPSAILSGAIFPLAVRLVVDEPGLAGAAVGRMAAVNTLGGIVGSLAIGFLVLPGLGMQAGLLLTSGVAVAAGCAACWWLDRRDRAGTRALAIAASVAAWLALPALLATRVPQDLLAAPHELIDYREGREANLAVIRRQGALQLEADRWWQGQDRKTHQVLAAHVPLLLHPSPQRVLVIGVGAGQTPASVLTHDIAQLDSVDIEPQVFDLVHAHFDHAWMDDDRSRLIREDGRSYLANTVNRYDVIALEVGQLSRPGVASFYSADFYHLARAHLEPNGILSQFVPLPFLSPETFRSLLATFLEVFPQSVLWYNTAELLLIGSNADQVALRSDRLALLTAPRIDADLRYSPWGGPQHWLNRPEVFLAGFLIGPQGLAELAAGAPVERDDRPQLAYASRQARAEDLNEIAIVELLRPHLAPIAGVVRGTVSSDLLAAATAERERNLADVTASARLRRVDSLGAADDPSALAALLDAAVRANPDNVRVHRLLGDLALQRQRAADAQAEYARALALDADDGASHLALARLLLMQGRAADAVAHYQRGLAQRPNDPEAHNDYAAALVQQQDYAGAQRHLERALELSPDYPQARENLSRLRAARTSGS